MNLRIVASICMCWGIFANAILAQDLLERLEKRLERVLNDPLPVAAPTDAEEAGYLGMVAEDAEDKQVRVRSVRSGSPAEAAGLKAGDVLLSIADFPVATTDDIARQLVDKLVGAKFEIKVARAGEVLTFPVTLGRKTPVADPILPPPRESLEPAPSPARAAPAGRPSLGITILPVSEEARQRYGLAVRQGALISAIAPGGAADRAGLPVGGVIVAAEGQRIEHPDDLIAIVSSMRPGDPLLLSYYQGAKVFRKSITLAEAGGVAVGPLPERPAPAPTGDRPLLRRIERALESAELPGRIPFAAEPAAEDLRGEVERLRTTVSSLERRIAELESILKNAASVEPIEPEASALELERPRNPRPPPRPEPPAER